MRGHASRFAANGSIWRAFASGRAAGGCCARASERPGPVLLLAHDPRRLTEAAALNVPAVLSGHTHGGQVVLPGVGAVAAGASRSWRGSDRGRTLQSS